VSADPGVPDEAHSLRKALPEAKATSPLVGMKSVAHLGRQKGDVSLPDNEPVRPDRVIKLRKGLKPDQVRKWQESARLQGLRIGLQSMWKRAATGWRLSWARIRFRRCGSRSVRRLSLTHLSYSASERRHRFASGTTQSGRFNSAFTSGPPACHEPLLGRSVRTRRSTPWRIRHRDWPARAPQHLPGP